MQSLVSTNWPLLKVSISNTSKSSHQKWYSFLISGLSYSCQVLLRRKFGQPYRHWLPAWPKIEACSARNQSWSDGADSKTFWQTSSFDASLWCFSRFSDIQSDGKSYFEMGFRLHQRDLLSSIKNWSLNSTIRSRGCWLACFETCLRPCLIAAFSYSSDWVDAWGLWLREVPMPSSSLICYHTSQPLRRDQFQPWLPQGFRCNARWVHQLIHLGALGSSLCPLSAVTLHQAHFALREIAASASSNCQQGLLDCSNCLQHCCPLRGLKACARCFGDETGCTSRSIRRLVCPLVAWMPQHLGR